MNKSNLNYLLAIALIALMCVPVRARGQGSATAQSWRTSWTSFVEAIDSFRKQNKEFPQASFQMVTSGQPVPDKWLVMKQFNGRVTFEGTFRRVTTDSLMEGMTAKLEFEMPKSPVAGAVLHLYPSAASLPTWKTLPTGAITKYSAVVTGVSGVEPLPGRIGYIVLLQNAEPLK